MNENEESSDSPFYRFSSIIPEEAMGELHVAIIGAGGIGAPAALALAKCGVKRLTIYDNDVVGPENIGPQMYGPQTIGQPKVLALRRFLEKQAPWCDVSTSREFYRGERIDADIMVAAVDSLEVRQTIWDGVKENSPQIRVIIDPRMGAEVLTVISVLVHEEEDHDWYQETLDGEPVEASCTAKSTFYTGLVAGAMVGQAVKAYVVGEMDMAEYSIDLRYLQFFPLTRTQKRTLYIESHKEAS